MKAHILTIGDELLLGQTINTNAAWIGEQLALLGIDVVSSSVVGDVERLIHEELDGAFERADLVITTGGLGPTHDDLTVQALASYFDVPLVKDEQLAGRISGYYNSTGRKVPEAVQKMTLIPEGFEALVNHQGTAPGLWYRPQQTDGDQLLVVLPGVPGEMKGLMQEVVLPRLREVKELDVAVHRTLRTTGIVESRLQEKIGDVSSFLDSGLRLAYLPSPSGVRLRLSAFASSRAEAEEALDTVEEYLRDRVGKYIYGTGKDTLELVVGKLLRERGLTIALAESCTGGILTHRLTNVSGSSAYVLGGLIAYSNALKVEHLDVDPDVLKEEGAVSEVVALQMARGARTRLGADIGVSTTGIAGPTGGTEEKPVGTIWVGYADATSERAVYLRFANDRLLNKELFSTMALETIRRQLLDL